MDDTTITLTWNTLLAAEPRLAGLEQDVRSAQAVLAFPEDLDAWTYKALRERLASLIGYGRVRVTADDPDFLRTHTAYERAIQHLFNNNPWADA
jgi:hypothetical protein